MTATWQAPPPPAPSRWGPGRVIALVVGILVLLPGLGLLVGGGVLLWADTGGRTADGYLLSSDDSFSTPGYALVSGRIDLSTGASWMPVSAALGDARLQVTAKNPSDEVFIGVARVGDSSPYLDGVQRTVITDFGSAPTAADQQLLPGNGPVTPPAAQDFWVAQASGSGTQQVTWTPTDGNWKVVVMNADGSANISVDAAVGATVPALTGLAWGVLGVGLVLVLLGVLAIVLAARRRPSPVVPYGAGVPMPVGPPPSWTPPAPVDRTTAADAAPTAVSSSPPEQGPPVRPGP